MTRLHCDRCGLTLEVRFASLSLEYCPRCLARARTASPMAVVETAEAARTPSSSTVRRRPARAQRSRAA